MRRCFWLAAVVMICGACCCVAPGQSSGRSGQQQVGGVQTQNETTGATSAPADTDAGTGGMAVVQPTGGRDVIIADPWTGRLGMVMGIVAVAVIGGRWTAKIIEAIGGIIWRTHKRRRTS